ncbi:hypothetical protein RvY_03443 [Ramazzottius varieornatus]|uniref:Phospholipase n=1 Tax=Ramazzottius varieornatus TaxID=947166 RepID=A0A1D1UYA8_RAMVA|nr:hypothetical protein RvY_03443 [Ramazzottius varieornatus]
MAQDMNAKTGLYIPNGGGGSGDYLRSGMLEGKTDGKINGIPYLDSPGPAKKVYDLSPSAVLHANHDADRTHLIETAYDEYETDVLCRTVVTTPTDKNISDVNEGRSVFLNGFDIVIRVVEVSRKEVISLKPVTYRIDVNHGGYYWTILRNYKQIRQLFVILYYYDERLRERSQKIPDRLPENASVEEITAHAYAMEDMLKTILNDPLRREHLAAVRFLEVTWMSFSDGPRQGHKKHKEVILKKMGCGIRDDLHVSCNHDNFACKILSHWKERWLILRDTCYLLLRPKTNEIAAVFMFDQRTKIEDLKTRPRAIKLRHNMKDLVFNFSNMFEKNFWIAQMRKLMQTTAAEWTAVDHPHNSFAPARDNVPAKFFINGIEYFAAVADAIEGAKKEIFIGAWWLSPDIFLKRPVTADGEWQIINLLKRVADRGVRIYILLFKESRAASAANSHYTKILLEGHPNIEVMRHPDANVILWTHHEKMVMVDQEMAFAGIDMCWGRWDDHHYRLSDQGPSLQAFMDQNLAQTDKGEVDRDCTCAPTMQSEKCKAKEAHKDRFRRKINASQAVPALRKQIRAHFNHPSFAFGGATFAKFKKAKKKMARGAGIAKRRMGGKTTTTEAEDILKQKAKDDKELLPGLAKKYLWIGNEYVNEKIKGVEQPKTGDPYLDQLERDIHPRLPWRDLGACVWGAPAVDAARNFIQKWNAIKLQKYRFEEEYDFLLPKSRAEVLVDVDALPDNVHSCRVQVLRSASSWSSGLSPNSAPEHSIEQAYYDIILAAKHYIYIENAFFTTIVADHHLVRNRVGDALVMRIERAHKLGETFRVYVILPLQQAMGGTWGTNRAAPLQGVMHYTYQSISRGGYSVLEQLRARGIDPTPYIFFCGLRTHGEISGKLKTEMVYVHSKLLIADDTTTIIGSANINDRSLVGEHDAEIAFLVEDQQFEESRMNGQPYACGKFSGRSRKRLMKICLCLLEDMPAAVSEAEADAIVQDPTCDSFYFDTWIQRAMANEQIFEEVFFPLPTNKVLTFQQVEENLKTAKLAETDPEQAKARLKELRGYVVSYPTEFLRDEDLKPKISQGVGLLPENNWV